MTTEDGHENIRVLIADDDEHILDAYREAFSEPESTREIRALDALAAELFDPDTDAEETPHFNVVACSQGDEAVSLTQQAADDGEPFDVVILDVRMPPGIDGVEAGSKIRELDPDVEIIFVTGYSDVPLEELQRRIPPPLKLHYLNKPLSFSQLAHDVASMVRSH
ncbi:MAG: response regulator [Gammaproteobacteria bacterium]|nr:response regulator [Gammaproteobacteria bacterium]MDH3750861.1 response regulator [Gammaproteobacteria bacterium]MDH3805951.1 response regulator [Gammaproteobacteria bacterium]